MVIWSILNADRVVSKPAVRDPAKVGSSAFFSGDLELAFRGIYGGLMMIHDD